MCVCYVNLAKSIHYSDEMFVTIVRMHRGARWCSRPVGQMVLRVASHRVVRMIAGVVAKVNSHDERGCHGHGADGNARNGGRAQVTATLAIACLAEIVGATDVCLPDDDIEESLRRYLLGSRQLSKRINQHYHKPTEGR